MAGAAPRALARRRSPSPGFEARCRPVRAAGCGRRSRRRPGEAASDRDDATAAAATRVRRVRKLTALAARSRRRAPSGSGAACRRPRSSGADSRCRRRASSTRGRSRSPRPVRRSATAVSTWRGLSMKSSSSENSVRVSSIGSPPRLTSRVAGSSSRSAKRSVSPEPFVVRRSSARSAGEQLRERKRLDDVVVRAGVEPRDPRLDLVARGQHQDRNPVAGARAAGARSRARRRSASARRGRSRPAGRRRCRAGTAPPRRRPRARRRSPRARARAAAIRGRPLRRRRRGSARCSCAHCCVKD